MSGVRSSVTSALVAASLSLVGCGAVGTAQTDLRDAVDARQSAMNECYQVALTRDDSIAGDVDVRLAMAQGTTQVRDVSLVRSEVEDETLTSCLRSELGDVGIEQAPGLDIEVDYTLRLQQGRP